MAGRGVVPLRLQGSRVNRGVAFRLPRVPRIALSGVGPAVVDPQDLRQSCKVTGSGGPPLAPCSKLNSWSASAQRWRQKLHKYTVMYGADRIRPGGVAYRPIAARDRKPAAVVLPT